MKILKGGANLRVMTAMREQIKNVLAISATATTRNFDKDRKLKLAKFDNFGLKVMMLFDKATILGVRYSKLCANSHLQSKKPRHQITLVNNREAGVTGEVTEIMMKIRLFIIEMFCLAARDSFYNLNIERLTMKEMLMFLDFYKNFAKFITKRGVTRIFVVTKRI